MDILSTVWERTTLKLSKGYPISNEQRARNSLLLNQKRAYWFAPVDDKNEWWGARAFKSWINVKKQYSLDTAWNQKHETEAQRYRNVLHHGSSKATRGMPTACAGCHVFFLAAKQDALCWKDSIQYAGQIQRHPDDYLTRFTSAVMPDAIDMIVSILAVNSMYDFPELSVIGISKRARDNLFSNSDLNALMDIWVIKFGEKAASGEICLPFPAVFRAVTMGHTTLQEAAWLLTRLRGHEGLPFIADNMLWLIEQLAQASTEELAGAWESAVELEARKALFGNTIGSDDDDEDVSPLHLSWSTDYWKVVARSPPKRCAAPAAEVGEADGARTNTQRSRLGSANSPASNFLDEINAHATSSISLVNCSLYFVVEPVVPQQKLKEAAAPVEAYAYPTSLRSPEGNSFVPELSPTHEPPSTPSTGVEDSVTVRSTTLSRTPSPPIASPRPRKGVAVRKNQTGGIRKPRRASRSTPTISAKRYILSLR